jgi:hypothetical protein
VTPAGTDLHLIADNDATHIFSYAKTGPSTGI